MIMGAQGSPLRLNAGLAAFRRPEADRPPAPRGGGRSAPPRLPPTPTRQAGQPGRVLSGTLAIATLALAIVASTLPFAAPRPSTEGRPAAVAPAGAASPGIAPSLPAAGELADNRTQPRPDALSPEVLEWLLRRGEALLAMHDVAAARKVLRRAAAGGSVPAALALARIDDPVLSAASAWPAAPSLVPSSVLPDPAGLLGRE